MKLQTLAPFANYRPLVFASWQLGFHSHMDSLRFSQTFASMAYET